ncbi:MAG TPA: extracellular solute-binding protein [Planctomycetota bacterium]|nr:extracellular solute-binding protein [Planctomycetota bacterium]
MHRLWKRARAAAGRVLLAAMASALLAACSSESDQGAAARRGEYEYVKWRADGGADLITFEDKEVISLSKEQLGTMFGKGQQPFAGKRIAVSVLNSGPKGGISGPLYRLRPAWQELTGAKLDIVEVPIAELLNKTMMDLQFGGGQFDGFVEAAWFMGEYITPGFIVPIDTFLADKRFPQWNPDWLPPALQAVYTWEGKWYGTLNDSDGQVLYWRNDILADPEWQKKYKSETGKDMPFPVKTWQDVLDIARFFNGKNWDANDSEPDTGIVMHFRVNEQGMFHFMSLSAPFVVLGGDKVNRGTNNYWFDPETLEPLINQPGHVRALEVLYELSKCGPAAQSAWDLGTAWDWFLRGKAVFVFSWGDVGALVQDEARSKIRGKLGAAAIPGSCDVYDMNAKTWRKLDQPNLVGNTVGGSWHGVISAKSKNPELVYSLYALMATEPVSLWNVNRGWTGVDPGARIHFLPPDGTATLKGYLDAGWNEGDLKFYLKAYHDNFYAATMLPYLRINGAEEYWRALDQNLSETMIGRLKPQEALDRTAKEWDAITDRRGRDAQLKQYQRSVGYRK